MVTFALVITSDRVLRGEVKDSITPLVDEALKREGHALVHRVIVPNDLYAIRNAVIDAVSRAEVVIVTGGTGLSPKDLSVEAVQPLATKELPGFGEVFRLKSLDQVGMGAILSRASAYLIGRSLVFVTPGSPQAVRLALDIILPIVVHGLGQTRGEPHH
ncbi:MAG: MogA/MoaB family molybdenum cofactor biosynthesis protein [Acidilobus sp.]